jgi:tetratricopeptide (TPR) repeat protein
MKPLQRVAHHFKRGEYDHVERLCGIILAKDPTEARAWQMRGLAALHRRQFADAAACLRESVALKESPQAYINLSAALLALDRPGEGIAPLRRALELDAQSAGAYLSLACCHFGERRYQDAEAAIERAVSICPGWPKALDMQARIALRIGDIERAFALANAALASDRSLSVSHRVLADIAMHRMDYDLAKTHYLRSIRNNPHDPEAFGNFALLLSRRGEYEDAIGLYKRAIAFLPDDEMLQHGLADMLLIQGRLVEGFPLQGWRHMRTDENLPLVDVPFPPALPKGPSAVAVLDQGVGDQIMMSNLIPDLTAQIQNLEVYCDPRLKTLFQRSFPNAEFKSYTHALRSTATASAAPGSFGMVDIAHWLRPSFDSFPRHEGYLKPDPQLRTALRNRYTSRPGPIIGIAWATRKSIKLGPHKSLPLAAWGPLLSIPGATFVNLQYDSDLEEVANAAWEFGARIISDPEIDAGGDLDDYAAQVAAMDLVISTSSASAHMGGALNVPTWVFVPLGIGGLWHWFTDREDSPWYPSVRLFRQSTRGEWGDVVERASTALDAFMQSWSAK